METFTLESILAFFSAAAILAVLVYADQLRRPLSLLHAVVILFAVSNFLRGCILLQGETIDLWDAWMRLAMTSLRHMGMVLTVAYAMSCVNVKGWQSSDMALRRSLLPSVDGDPLPLTGTARRASPAECVSAKV